MPAAGHLYQTTSITATVTLHTHQIACHVVFDACWRKVTVIQIHGFATLMYSTEASAGGVWKLPSTNALLSLIAQGAQREHTSDSPQM